MFNDLDAQTPERLIKIFHDNHRAFAMLSSGTKDYAAARCLLIYGHTPGFALGAQAIEKFLKFYLLIRDTSRNVRGMKHLLRALLNSAIEIAPQLQLDRFQDLIRKFGEHYQTRYPDNENQSKIMTTADLHELDEFMIYFSETIALPRNIKIRSGTYAAITFSLNHDGQQTPQEQWIKEKNRHLIPILPQIRLDYIETMMQLYPNNPELANC